LNRIIDSRLILVKVGAKPNRCKGLPLAAPRDESLSRENRTNLGEIDLPMPKRIRLPACALVTLVALGCAGPGVLVPGDKAPVASRPLLKHSDPAYRVATGDVLDVVAGDNSERVEVRTDGRLKLASGEALRVDNMTPRQIASDLAQRLGDPYRDCKVTVAKYNSQFIYVFGDNRKEAPRAVPYQGKESLSDFLKRVGCQHCWRGYRARVVRPNEKVGASPEIVAVKLDAGLKSRDPAQKGLTLQPNDHIYLERDAAGPGDLMPKSSKFWPLTKWFSRPEHREGAKLVRAD
jgi:protein involved in polysaccharide export with SLBB domain